MLALVQASLNRLLTYYVPCQLNLLPSAGQEITSGISSVGYRQSEGLVWQSGVLVLGMPFSFNLLNV